MPFIADSVTFWGGVVRFACEVALKAAGNVE